MSAPRDDALAGILDDLAGNPVATPAEAIAEAIVAYAAGTRYVPTERVGPDGGYCYLLVGGGETVAIYAYNLRTWAAGSRDPACVARAVGDPAWVVVEPGSPEAAASGAWPTCHALAHAEAWRRAHGVRAPGPMFVMACPACLAIGLFP